MLGEYANTPVSNFGGGFGGINSQFYGQVNSCSLGLRTVAQDLYRYPLIVGGTRRKRRPCVRSLEPFRTNLCVNLCFRVQFGLEFELVRTRFLVPVSRNVFTDVAISLTRWPRDVSCVVSAGGGFLSASLTRHGAASDREK